MRSRAALRYATRWLCLAAMAGAVEIVSAGPAPPPDRAQIEADWLRQDEVRGPMAKVTPEEDAAGACDGLKDGKWGFHTALENDPWWRVDLGQVRPLDRVLLYNRCDHTASRAAQIEVALSDDGRTFRPAYRHNGQVFLGHPDGKPLAVPLHGAKARFVRLQVPGNNCLHLDEVELFESGTGRNVALGRPATQSSTCEWSTRKGPAQGRRAYPFEQAVQRGRQLAIRLRAMGVDVETPVARLGQIASQWAALPPDAPDAQRRQLYFDARWTVRRLALANPLLDFDDLLVATSAPALWSHMSDQYLGWWSQPGGALYVLERFKTEQPRLRSLTPGLPPGNVLRPDVSYDGRKVLFAWCRHHPGLSTWPDKLDKTKLPEDSFYHLFEMGVDGTGLRQLTRGKYNDFDGRYLPNGEIVFCSTRRGHATQYNRSSAAATLADTQRPECYVRCGGGPERPCAVYTLHAMDLEGRNLRPISAFEMFEWTPSVDHEGRILYSRWDYVDRYGQNAMGLWATMPDGTGSQALFGNFTRNPECFFEARAVPGSRKIVFTASGHHSITAGSLVLLDPTQGADVAGALKRLTPEVPFPESEGSPATYYANPWPLAEDFYLVAWSDRPLKFQGQVNDVAALGVYLYDAFGNLELLYRDPAIGSQYPLPIRARPRPKHLSPQVHWESAEEAQLLLLDVYQGLDAVARGAIKRLRIVGMPVKQHPTMNYPEIGLTTHDSGRFVLGTVPVEADGSAFFRVPSGVTLFVQALDEEGMAVQTMRSATYLMPGQTQTCVGCHEHRGTAPPNVSAAAARRAPSRIQPGPEGSWPLDYQALVQPVLDRKCLSCHKPGTKGEKFDLTPQRSYQSMVTYGKPSLKEVVVDRYRQQRSIAGSCEARTSALVQLLARGHYDVRLDPAERDRLVIWMDTLGQQAGHFSPQQADELRRLKQGMAALLEPR